MSDKSKKSKEMEVINDLPLDEGSLDTASINEDVRADKDKRSEDGKKNLRMGLIKKKDRDPILHVSAIVLAIACMIVICNTVFDIAIADRSDPPIEYGDKVVVDYIGCYQEFYDKDNLKNGAIVFDTSLSSLKDSDVMKSYEYNPAYKQLNVEIGKGKYLKAFEEALIGHVPGDVVKVCIPNGYGEAQLYDFTNTANIKMADVLTADEFKSLFGFDAPSANSGLMYLNAHTEIKEKDEAKYSPFGFPAVISTMTDGTVAVNYMPEEGNTYIMSEDVSVKVDSVKDGVAKITYELKKDTKRDFVKVIVDNNNAIYVYPESMKYKTTDEKTGEDLYFTITIVKYE